MAVTTLSSERAIKKFKIEIETPEKKTDSAENVSLFKDINRIPCFGRKQIKELVESHLKKVEKENACVYLALSNIDLAEFSALEKYRDKSGLHLRMTYYGDVKSLIIKFPATKHEKAHAALGRLLDRTLHDMGVSMDEFVPRAASKYVVQKPSGRTSKEGDSTYVNELIRPKDVDWPFLVIEAGDSESLPHLILDANWWIRNSAGQVHIVLCIKIYKHAKKIRILKFVPSSRPLTRNNPSGIVPHLEAEVTIDMSTTPPQTKNAPLILEFNRVIGRPPAGQEADIQLTSQDLETWAGCVFRG